MPQITQLPLIYASQLFWLVVTFGLIFFGIGLGMLPKIRSTMESRDQRISDDLAEAQRARAQADETETAWRARMDESRVEAMKLTAAAKQETARETELRIKAADAEANGKVEAAEDRIRSATEGAMAEIETVAVEAAQDMVSRLAGVTVSRDRAVAAVKEALNG